MTLATASPATARPATRAGLSASRKPRVTSAEAKSSHQALTASPEARFAVSAVSVRISK